MNKSSRIALGLALFGPYFFLVWGFLSYFGNGVQLTINGEPITASPVWQGAWVAMLLPLVLLAATAIFFVIFSFTWVSLALMALAALLMAGLAFVPLVAPGLIPLAVLFLSLAIDQRQSR